MQLEAHEKNVLLVSLLHYQDSGKGNKDVIDGLMEKIKAADNSLPTAVIDVEGGVINNVNGSCPMRIIILDADTEGGDCEQIKDVCSDDVYVSDHSLQGDSASREYIAEVISALATQDTHELSEVA